MMYVAVPVGTAADKWREGKKNHTDREGKGYSTAEACPHAHAQAQSSSEEVNAYASENECFMNTFENSFFLYFY